MWRVRRNLFFFYSGCHESLSRPRINRFLLLHQKSLRACMRVRVSCYFFAKAENSTPIPDILSVSKAYILSPPPFFFFLQLRRNWHSLYIKCCSLSRKMIFRIQSPRPNSSLAIGFWEIPHWEAPQTEASETHHPRPCECPLEQIFWKHYPGEKKNYSSEQFVLFRMQSPLTRSSCFLFFSPFAPL